MAAPIFFTRAARCMASRSKSIAFSALNHSPPTRRLVASSTSRLASALGAVETEKPLHSVIASARLRSNIATLQFRGNDAKHRFLICMEHN
ncbi:hypothetical protein AKJ16_DCAP25167 [Drosera capensis]